jgi:RNA-binding motif X-linked protein 2
MRDYLIAQRKEEKAKKKDKKKYKSSRHKDETAEERAARKAHKREKKAKKTDSSKKNKAKGAQGAHSGGKSETMRAVEDMLKKLGDPDMARAAEGSSGRRRGSETPEERGHRDRAYRRHSRSRSRSPGAPPRQSENQDRDYHRRRLPTRTPPVDGRDDRYRKRFSDDEEGRSRRRPSSRDRLGR